MEPAIEAALKAWFEANPWPEAMVNGYFCIPQHPRIWLVQTCGTKETWAVRNIAQANSLAKLLYELTGFESKLHCYLCGCIYCEIKDHDARKANADAEYASWIA